MFEDSENDHFKCGTIANQAFNLQNDAATLSNCKASCDSDDSCIAFSGTFGSWCMGCRVALDTYQSGAVAYKKADQYNMDVMLSDIAVFNRALNESEILQLYGAGRPSAELRQNCQRGRSVYVTYTLIEGLTTYSESEHFACPLNWLVADRYVDGTSRTLR